MDPTAKAFLIQAAIVGLGHLLCGLIGWFLRGICARRDLRNTKDRIYRTIENRYLHQTRGRL